MKILQKSTDHKILCSGFDFFMNNCWMISNELWRNIWMVFDIFRNDIWMVFEDIEKFSIHFFCTWKVLNIKKWYLFWFLSFFENCWIVLKFNNLKFQSITLNLQTHPEFAYNHAHFFSIPSSTLKNNSPKSTEVKSAW